MKTKFTDFTETDKYIYHGTSKGAALNIQRDGYMKPSNTGDVKPSISFTEFIKYANYYASAKGGTDKMVVLRTKLTDDFTISTKIRNNKGHEYVTFENLPSDKLEILTLECGWKPLDTWDVVFNEPKN